jgi:hypothetical protein
MPVFTDKSRQGNRKLDLQKSAHQNFFPKKQDYTK